MAHVAWLQIFSELMRLRGNVDNLKCMQEIYIVRDRFILLSNKSLTVKNHTTSQCMTTVFEFHFHWAVKIIIKYNLLRFSNILLFLFIVFYQRAWAIGPLTRFNSGINWNSLYYTVTEIFSEHFCRKYSPIRF